MFDGTKTFSFVALLVILGVVLTCLMGYQALGIWMAVGAAFGLPMVRQTCLRIDAKDKRGRNP